MFDLCIIINNNHNHNHNNHYLQYCFGFSPFLSIYFPHYFSSFSPSNIRSTPLSSCPTVREGENKDGCWGSYESKWYLKLSWLLLMLLEKGVKCFLSGCKWARDVGGGSLFKSSGRFRGSHLGLEASRGVWVLTQVVALKLFLFGSVRRWIFAGSGIEGVETAHRNYRKR